MNKQDQRISALNQKIRGERRLRLMLLPWIKEVAGTYRLGITQISGDDKNDLKRLLKKYYQQMVNDIMGFDTRQFKDELEDMIDEYYRSVSMHLENTMYVHNLTASAQIANTMEGYMKRVNELAIANGWTPIEARAALVNYMRAHSLVVATTEAQFITEATRTVAIRVVNDPLKDTLMKVVELIESGDNNAARRLSRRAMRLINQPLSMAQGETIAEFREMTSDRSLLMTPEVQGRVIANLRERGRALGKKNKYWSAIGDSKTRETHLDAADRYNEDASIPNDQPFIVGGYRLQHPGDASLGASLSEIINCVVEDTMISANSKIKKLYRREYSGEVIKISTANGLNVTVTPNHPIFTDGGWVKAGMLDKGNKIGTMIGKKKFVKSLFSFSPNKKYIPSTIEEMFDFALIKFYSRWIRGIEHNFHGDGSDCNIDIIFIDGFFKNWIKSIFNKYISKLFIPIADSCKMFFASLRSIYHNIVTPFISTNGIVSIFGNNGFFFFTHLGHSGKHSLTSVSIDKSNVTEMPINNISIDVKPSCNLLNGNSGFVEFDKIIGIERIFYHGFVYNLETKDNYYMAGDSNNVKQIILHNCRCAAVYI